MNSNFRILLIRVALSGAILFCINGCAFNRVKNAQQNLAHNSQENGFKSIILLTSYFPFQAHIKSRNSQSLHVYIEGDGLAWVDTHVISNDPTPSDPIGFDLAAVDASKSDVVYLARPCQFVRNSKCENFYWTSGRFHKKIINSYHQILDQLKLQHNYKNMTLFGYSGGAAVALLIAAERNDVKEVITFAGTLDHQAWTRFHDFTPLQDSLNPIDYAEQLHNIPQTHFVGEEDKTMPMEISQSYLKKLGFPQNIRLIKTPLNHYEGWAALWQSHALNH